MTPRQMVIITKLMGKYKIKEIDDRQDTSALLTRAIVRLAHGRGHFNVYPDGTHERFNGEGIFVAAWDWGDQ